MNNHICGLSYALPNGSYYGSLIRYYLPQVKLDSHTTILSLTSRTKLTQKFVNPSQDKAIKQVRYTFPLYDGVSVVGFTCRVADRVITGEVKEKEKARAVFDEAVQRGETAGLLEQLPDASDVFTTTIGNVPPNATIIVEITYLGELKHDAEVDGIRFTIPTAIAPRYGNYPGELLGRDSASAHADGGISITVDATMNEGSCIKEMRSPSHPIAVAMGTTSVAPTEDPTLTKASATLSLGKTELDKDFVLQIIAKDTGIPKALLETHPTIPQQRAIMATLVPKFALPPSRPEIVFICDRSGSMAGSSIHALVAALRVFLKSLPVGVKFNICSFGSSYSFLWDRSKTYSKASLDEAMKHIQTFEANFGGTEMFAPIKETFTRRYKDMALEVFLVTDGEIWNQHTLFEYLNKEVIENKAPIRVFTLGIGSGASSALIEGVARAGNGFSQAVANPNEKLDAKVVRMLKGALSPHVTDYTLEVKYHDEDTDDFEIVEKVSESLRVKLDLTDNVAEKKKAPISLFDISVDSDDQPRLPQLKDDDGQARYSHLPTVPTPKLMQAPHKIPPLFPFIRTSVYLLLSPLACQKIPSSVILRGTSAHGPLELDIPIEDVGSGETIHQLAAKKAIAELEQGRGWLSEAHAEDGNLLKAQYEGRFDEMVEREAVRLGVQFQVGGKWCSFVAVEKKDKQNGETSDLSEFEYLDAPSEKSTDLDNQIPMSASHIRRSESARIQSAQSASIQSPRYAAASSYSTGGRPAYAAPANRIDSMGLHNSQQSLQMAAVPMSTAARSFKPGAQSESSSASSGFGFRSATRKVASSVSGSLFGSPGGVAQGLGSSTNVPQGPPVPLPSRASASASRAQVGSLFGSPNSGFGNTSSLFAASSGDSVRQYAQGAASGGFAQPTQQQMASTSRFSGNIMPVSHAMEEMEDDEDQGLNLFDDEELVLFEDSSSAARTADCTSTLPSKVLDYQKALMLREWHNKKRLTMARQDSAMDTQHKKQKLAGHRSARSASHAQVETPKSPADPLQALIELQDFEGYWKWSTALFDTIGIEERVALYAFGEKRVYDGAKFNMLATVLAIAFCQVKLEQEKESWELVVEKAKEWLAGSGADSAKVARCQSIAVKLMK